ncbi:MAG TPA: glycosyltransferase, partial [Dehalococcoidia bacterium]|nr:glycosyltransferase [Dehalococcoidia bacterium]
MNESADGRRRLAILTSVHPPLDMRVFDRQARSMAAAGWDVLLIAPGAPAGTKDGVRFASLPTFGGRLGRPLRWPVLLWKALHARPDIYHFHDPELLPLGVVLRWLSRRPVVYDSHEFLVEDIRGKHWIPRPIRGTVASLAGKVERWCSRRLSAVVVVTEEMRERFLPENPKTILVRNLVENPNIPYPPDKRQPVVIYAGLMNVQRGLDILYETASIVRSRNPEAEFHILGPVEWFGIPRRDRERPASEWAEVG